MASKIPIVKTDDKDLTIFQTQLGKVLTPLLDNPINYGTLLSKVSLQSGSTNVIATTLNRDLQGWFIVRKRASATIWDTQDVNTMPSQTLLLNTSANVVVDLWVY